MPRRSINIFSTKTWPSGQYRVSLERLAKNQVWLADPTAPVVNEMEFVNEDKKPGIARQLLVRSVWDSGPKRAGSAVRRQPSMATFSSFCDNPQGRVADGVETKRGS